MKVGDIDITENKLIYTELYAKFQEVFDAKVSGKPSIDPTTESLPSVTPQCPAAFLIPHAAHVEIHLMHFQSTPLFHLLTLPLLAF